MGENRSALRRSFEVALACRHRKKPIHFQSMDVAAVNIAQTNGFILSKETGLNLFGNY